MQDVNVSHVHEVVCEVIGEHELLLTSFTLRISNYISYAPSTAILPFHPFIPFRPLNPYLANLSPSSHSIRVRAIIHLPTLITHLVSAVTAVRSWI